MLYTAKIKAFYHDCDVQGHLKLSAAMRYMQQISGDHLESLGFSAEKLLSENMVFMLSRTCIKFHRIPLATELMMLSTAPTAVKGVRFVREFAIDSTHGERLISATTLWVLIDPASRKILRPSSFPYGLPLHPSFASGDTEDIVIPKLTLEPTQRSNIDIRYSHLDINNHVSNSLYADFICDILPYEHLLERGIDSFAINFQNEVKLAQTLLIERSDIDTRAGEYYMRGKSSENSQCFEAFIKLGPTRA